MAFAFGSLLLTLLILAAHIYARGRRERMSFAHALRTFFSPPQFADEGKTRVAVLIVRIARGALVTIVILVPAVALTAEPGAGLLVLAVGALAVALALWVLFLAHEGLTRAARFLLPALLWAVLSYTIYSFGGIRNAATSGYIMLVAVAALLLGGRGAVGFALLSTLTILALYYGETNGLLPTRYEWVIAELRPWVIYVYAGFFFLTTLLMRLVVRTIGEGLDNARQLLAAERQRAQHMELLSDITRAALGTSNLKEMLQIAADRLAELLDADGAYVTLWDETRQRTVPAASSGELRDEYPKLSVDPGETTLTESVLRAGHSLAVEDVFHTPYLSPRIAARFPARSMLALPLIAGDQKLGAALIAFNQTHRCTPEEIAVGEQAAGQIAAALAKARLLESEHKRARQLELLTDIARQLTGHDDREALMTEAVQHLQADFGFEFATLFLVEDGDLALHAASGAFADLAHAHERIPLGRGIIGWAAQTGQPYWTNDTAADEHFLPLPGADVRSELAVPLRLGKTVIGVLNVESERAGVFDDTDVSTVQSLADLLAAGLQTSEAISELRDREQLAEALQRVGAAVSASLDLNTVLNTVCREALQVFHADGVGAWLVEGEVVAAAASQGEQTDAVLGQRVSLHDPTSVVARAVREGRPLFVNNLQRSGEGVQSLVRATQTQAMLVAPIARDGQPLGALVIGDTRNPQRFGSGDVAAAELLGSQLAIAIQNARLFESEHRRSMELEALRQASLVLTSRLELQALLEAILHQVLQLAGGNDAHIFLFDGERLTFGAAIWADGRQSGPVAEPRPDGLTYAVARSGERMVVGDVDRHPLFANWRWGGAIVGLPLRVGDHVRGVMNMAFETPHTFTESELRILGLLADQAAIALENARLHAELKAHVNELSGLLTAHATLLSTLELDPLLHNVLAAAISAIPAAEKGTILLLDRPTGQLQIRANIGYTDPRVRTFAFAGNSGYSAKALRENRALIIADARDDATIRYDGDLPEVLAIQSAIVVPLLLPHSTEGPFGVIALDSTRREAFDTADLRLLMAFAKTASMAIDHAGMHAEAKAQALTDSLTNLANRRAFDHALETEVARAERYGEPVALIVADIDSFKQYNDTYGHPAGDVRLKAMANLLRGGLRDPDLAARYGGEEFALILPHTLKAGALVLAERLRAGAEAAAPQPATPGAPVPGYTISFGVAAFPEDGQTVEQLLLAADNAELDAKRAGKNRVMAAQSLTPR